MRFSGLTRFSRTNLAPKLNPPVAGACGFGVPKEKDDMVTGKLREFD